MKEYSLKSMDELKKFLEERKKLMSYNNTERVR